jgi:hypothetical protein
MRNEKPRLQSRIEIRILAGSALALACGLAYASPTPAPHMFGSLFGVAPNQTVRSSVASVDNPDFHGGPSKLPPGPCMVQLKIFNADGSVIVQSEFQRIAPGGSFSHDLKYSDLARLVAVDPKDGFRAQLRVASFVSGPDGSSNRGGCPSDPSRFKLSVEVFDDVSGRTSFMVPTDAFVPAVQ